MTASSTAYSASLPLELAEAILVTCIRSVRYIRRSDVINQVPYLTVAPRSVMPEVTRAAIARQVWADMDHASACGDVGLLNLMVRMSKEGVYAQSLVLLYTNNAMDVASERGHLHVLDWWFAHRDLLPLKYSSAAIDTASELGLVDVLEWWKTISGLPLKYSISALSNAARNGHANVLDWWLKQGNFDPQGYSCLNGFLDLVGVTGHIAVLQWWLAHRELVARQWTRDPCTHNLVWTAFENGNAHILDWALEHIPKYFVDNIMADNVHGVIEYGKRNSLEWLTGRKVRIPENFGVEWAVFRNKDKELGQWLLDSGISQVSLEVFLRAFECADVDYVEWCFERLNEAMVSQVTEADMVHMFLTASSVGSVDLLEWIVVHFEWQPAQLKVRSFPPMEIDGRECTRIEECFPVASQNGHVAVLDWLAKNGIPCLDPQLALECLHAASFAGKPQVLHWLSQDHSRSSVAGWGVAFHFVVHPADILAQALRVFDDKDAEQYIGVLEWYWEHFQSLFKGLKNKTQHGFSTSVGLLDWWAKVVEPSFSPDGPISLDEIKNASVLQWWLASGRSDYSYTASAMDQASANGHIELLKCWRRFALAQTPGPQDTTSQADHPVLQYSNAAMDNASRNGHLEVLEWWAASGIHPLKYSKRALKFTPLVTEEKRAEIVRWWLSSGLP